MFLLWHPSLTAINLSYTFPILETSATALCGTTGTISTIYYSWSLAIPTSCACCCRVAGNGLQVLPWKRNAVAAVWLAFICPLVTTGLPQRSFTGLKLVMTHCHSKWFPRSKKPFNAFDVYKYGPRNEVGMARQIRQRHASGATKFKDLSFLWILLRPCMLRRFSSLQKQGLSIDF